MKTASHLALGGAGIVLVGFLAGLILLVATPAPVPQGTVSVSTSTSPAAVALGPTPVFIPTRTPETTPEPAPASKPAPAPAPTAMPQPTFTPNQPAVPDPAPTVTPQTPAPQPAPAPAPPSPAPAPPASPPATPPASPAGDATRMRLLNGRILMHGAPKFLLGVYDSGLSFTTRESYYEQALFAEGGARRLGDIPFNYYLNFYYGSASVSSLLALMNVLQRHGMMYVQTANSFADKSYTRYDTSAGPAFTIDKSAANIKELAAHPGYAGVYLADEPADALHAETLAHSHYILGADPSSVNLTVLINNPYSRNLGLWADIPGLIGIDPYPLTGTNDSEYWVADAVARLRTAIGKSRPVLAVLQFFEFRGSPFPNYKQLKTHAVMSIVEGAQGIMWWQLGPSGLLKSSPAVQATAMANLQRLVTTLSNLQTALVANAAPQALTGNSTCTGDPVAWRKAALAHNLQVEWLFSAKESFKAELAALQRGDISRSYLLDQSCDVRTKVTVVGGKGYLFAYNYTSKDIGPVTFSWRRGVSLVTVLDEARTLTPSGSNFSDSFGPYEAHIYEITE